MDHTQVIIRPVVSEKSYVLASNGRYTFRVHPDAHKTQIREAVEALFDVHVEEVRTLSVKSKPKRDSRGRCGSSTKHHRLVLFEMLFVKEEAGQHENNFPESTKNI